MSFIGLDLNHDTMSKNVLKSIISGSIWGIVSKLCDSAAKFITIPLLIGFYGKSDYGLIALAFSLNAYLRLMDMGFTVGSIRYFSIWIAEGKWDKVQNVARSSVVFYSVIGLINACVFLYVGCFGSGFFNLIGSQAIVFKWMMFVLAGSAIVNWSFSVVNQLLTAHGEIGWVNKTTLISSLLNFAIAYIAVKLNLSLPIYFLLYIISTVITIPINIFRLRIYKLPILSFLLPKWNKVAFGEVFKYSAGIFAMGLFQFSADSLRPILLGKFASNGISVLTDYRVIQTISMLVMAFGSVFMQVLLPSTSKVFAEKDQQKIDTILFKGTKYISILLCFLVFNIVCSSENLLVVYMGTSYEHLAIWLNIWLVTLLYMHNTPVSSFILSTGKTTFLIYTSAISCLVSLPVTVVLASRYNIGAAVMGYAVYIVLQLGFSYFYYLPKVLKINSYQIFVKNFLPSLLIGSSCCIVAYYVSNFIVSPHKLYLIVLTSLLFSTMYLVLILKFVLNQGEIAFIVKKFRTK